MPKDNKKDKEKRNSLSIAGRIRKSVSDLFGGSALESAAKGKDKDKPKGEGKEKEKPKSPGRGTAGIGTLPAKKSFIERMSEALFGEDEQ